MAREQRGDGGGGRGRRDRGAPQTAEERADAEIVEKLVHINRVAATVKGGRRFSFAALMVVGDQKGRVGFGHGKAREVPEAIRKATEEAKKSMIRVPLRESRTLHHDGAGRWGAGKVMVRAAPPGTGVIAGGPMRAVLETLGVQDVMMALNRPLSNRKLPGPASPWVSTGASSGSGAASSSQAKANSIKGSRTWVSSYMARQVARWALPPAVFVVGP